MNSGADIPRRTPGAEIVEDPEPGIIAFDVGAGGLRAAVRVGSAFLPISLSRAGLTPPSLITFRESDKGVDFPTLMELIGEEQAVSVAGQTDKPHVLLRNLLASVRAPLEAWWGPVPSLGFVVSGFATDLQRSLLQKAARAAGWPSCSLVNKTTALALHGLRRLRPGLYVALVLGYSGAEASVIQWEGKQLRALSYGFDPLLAGGAWDSMLLRLVTALAKDGVQPLPAGLYNRQDWILLREQMELVRRRLDVNKSVIWPVPAGLYEGNPQEFALLREHRDEVVGRSLEGLHALLSRCCREGGTELASLQGAIVTGGLVAHRPLRERLFRLMGNRSVRILAEDAQCLGACQLAAEELGSGLAGVAVAESTTSLRLPCAQRVSEEVTGQRDTLELIIERVRALAAAGKRVEARAELGRLQEYVRAIDMSIDEPGVALRNMSSAPSAAGPEAAPKPAAASKPLFRADALEKSERRKYLLAKEDIKAAEKALVESRLEQAVSLSHAAYQKSADGRIFNAMVEVHIRAAMKRPPRLDGFDDEKRWLLCALNDDQTSARVQEAVNNRFLTHVSQLVQTGSPEAHSAAINTLVNLRKLALPQTSQVDDWLRVLKHSAPGTVKLEAGEERA